MASSQQGYTEDQQPCIIAVKPCGCSVGACVLDDSDLGELEAWNGDDLDAPKIIEFVRDMSMCKFVLRPVSFVRAGGLNFDCRHKAEATHHGK